MRLERSESEMLCFRLLARDSTAAGIQMAISEDVRLQMRRGETVSRQVDLTLTP